MNLKITILLLIFLSSSVYASFLEENGASASSLGLAGQTNLVDQKASANYYLPASLAFNKELIFEASTFGSIYKIKPINNIVVENSINTESGEEKLGDVSNDFSELLLNSLSFSLPLLHYNSTVNLTIITPYPSIAEFDTGDPYSPEYVFLKARPRRPQAFFNIAFGIKENIALSVGAHFGVKVDAELFTKAAVNNDEEEESTLYTYASARGEAAPKLAPVLSAYYSGERLKAGLTYMRNLDSNLTVNLTADEISTGIIFDSIIENVVYSDPTTLKLQSSFIFSDRLVAHGSLTYQLWKKFQTPKINIKPLAIMEGTFDYEKVQLRNTISPRIAMTFAINEKIKLNAGLSYKPSPIDSDYTGSGNTIHSDIYGIAISPEMNVELMKKVFNLNFSVAHEVLESVSVTKTVGQENGENGRKIGAPGYKIGGNITTISFGVGVNI